jgi:hypothetical protein
MRFPWLALRRSTDAATASTAAPLVTKCCRRRNPRGVSDVSGESRSGTPPRFIKFFTSAR